MIVRAVFSKPKILMFDEATSVFDNTTQKIISDSLEKLKCTRIAIAHKFLVIKYCDRILVLDGSKIIKRDKYDTLINNGEFFTSLIQRQQLEERV